MKKLLSLLLMVLMLLGGATLVLGIPVSVSGKSPFFDRK